MQEVVGSMEQRVFFCGLFLSQWKKRKRKKKGVSGFDSHQILNSKTLKNFSFYIKF
jgi:heme-degrading monooxygenase HmoA